MSYTKIEFKGTVSFSWNYPYTGGAIIADVNDISGIPDPDNLEPLQAMMPPADDAPLGTQVLFNNIGLNSINLVGFGSGQTIIVLSPKSTVNVYSTDTSSSEGKWGVIQASGGDLGIIELNVKSLDPAIIIDGGTVNAGNIGNIAIDTKPILKSLGSVASVGVLANTTASGSIAPIKLVGGSGVNISNADGKLGDISIALNNELSGITKLNVGNIELSSSSITTTDNSLLSLNKVTIDKDSNVTIPGKLIFNGVTFPTLIKAFVVFNNVLTTDKSIISISSQKNISQVGVSSGYYTITFLNSFSDIKYGVLISLGSSGTPPNIGIRHGYVISKQMDCVVIVIVDASGQILFDAPDVTIAIIAP